MTRYPQSLFTRIAVLGAVSVVTLAVIDWRVTRPTNAAEFDCPLAEQALSLPTMEAVHPPAHLSERTAADLRRSITRYAEKSDLRGVRTTAIAAGYRARLLNYWMSCRSGAEEESEFAKDHWEELLVAGGAV